MLFFVTPAGIPLTSSCSQRASSAARWRPVAIVVIAMAVVGTLVINGALGDVEVENPVVTSIAPALEAREPRSRSRSCRLRCSAWRRSSFDGGGASAGTAAARWLVAVAVLAVALLVGAIASACSGLHRVGDLLGGVHPHADHGIPVSAGIALLRHHVHGIEVGVPLDRVRRLAALITSMYAVVVAGAGTLVGRRSERSNVLLAVAATVAAAIIVHPARQRAQRFADRIIYGDRASLFELVSTFSERLGTASYDDALPQMARLVADGIGADEVRVWPGPAPSSVPHRAGRPRSPALRLPRCGSSMTNRLPRTSGVPGALPRDPAGCDHGEDAAPGADDTSDRASARGSGVSSGARRPQRLPRRGAAGVTRTIGDIARRGAAATRARSARRSATAAGHPLHGPAPRSLESGCERGRRALVVTETAEGELARSLAELRELARGIHPAILTQNGLGAALRSLAERSPVPVELRCVPDGRFADPVEATTYFLVSEALANVAKHAGASHASVAVRRGGDRLEIEVSDDGSGGASIEGGTGLRGLADRVAAVGGRMDLRSVPGAGTTVLAEIPCE